MAKRRLVLLLAGAFLPAAGPAHAACPPANPALVVEHGRDDPVRRDDSRTLAELTRLTRERRIDANPRSHTFGVTESTLETRVHVTMETRRAPGGGACAAAREVHVLVHLVDRRVYIAREALADRCVYDEVVGHEQRHVALDDALMPELAAEIRRALMGPVARLTARPVRSNAELRREAQRAADEVNRLVASLPLGERRRERHAAEVDTPAEYDRFSRACDGAVGAIIRRAGGAKLARGRG